jgi:hypothetical protein
MTVIESAPVRPVADDVVEVLRELVAVMHGSQAR